MLPTKLVHLAEGFQRRLKCEKLMEDKRRTPSDGKSSHCLWQGELIKLRCSGRVSSSCSTSDTHRANLVTNSVISDE